MTMHGSSKQVNSMAVQGRRLFPNSVPEHNKNYILIQTVQVRVS